MARNSELRVTISGDARQLNRALRGAGRNLEQFGRQTSLHGRLSSRGFSGIAVAARGATAGVGALAAAGGYFVKQYEESAKVGRQTAAVLKSTGGAANVTAKQVDSLANAISRKTGIDDEAIASGENLLLTFTSIRNETGKGNDIFNRATSAITDLSVALGQDMKSSAIQVGKALNDPIRGVTALRRVGVSFTAQQQAQIKTLVETGHQMDAQRLILRELNKEFGGSARAAATPFDKLKVSLGNLAETIGKALAPTVRRAAEALTKFVNEMMDGTGAGGSFVDTLRDIARALAPVAAFLGRVIKFLAQHPRLILAVAAAWGTYKVAVLASAVATRLANVTMVGTAMRVERIATLAPRMAVAMRVAFTSMLGPIGAVVAALAAAQSTIQALTGGDLSAGPGESTTDHGGDRRVGPGTHPRNPGRKIKPTDINPVTGRPYPKSQVGKPPRASPRSGPMASAAAVVASAAAAPARAVARVASAMPMARASSTLGLRQLEELWIRAGGDPSRAEMMARIALRESSGNPGATNFKGPDHSIGLWQINQKAWKGQFGSDRTLMNPLANAKAAVGVFRAQGPRAWSTYNAATDAKYIGRGGSRRAPARPQIKRGTSLMAAGIIAKKFGLRISSGYRTPEHNAAVGGVDGSYHTRGSASNPGAVDLVGSSSAMSKASAWASSHVSPLAENMVHNAGSGLHLHLGFASSSVTVRLDPGDSGAGSGGFAAAAAKPPTQAEINQSHFQAVSNRLETIGLKRDAGLIGAGTADRQTISTIGQALHGRFGSLSGRDKLSLMGTQRQTRQELTGRLKAKKATRSHGPFNGFLRVYNGIQDQIDAGNVDPEVGRRQQMAHAQFALDGQYGKLTSGDRLKVQKLLRQLREGGPEAPDPTSFAGTAFDDAALTQAQVDTPNDQTDDIGVLQGRLDIASAAYAAAKASGDRSGIATWGSLVQSLRSDISSAQGSGSQADLAQAMKELTEQIKAQNNFAAQVTSVSLGEAWRALSDVISGQISGVGYAGRASSAGSGQVARY